MSRFEIVAAEQRSPEWLAARAGRATGSRADAILAKLKSGGEAAARRDYRMQLVAERLTGAPQESGFINAEMQHGIDSEPAGRAAYEVATGNIVRCTGFLAMTEFQAGCSLDGDINEFEGILEIKAPKTATHVAYIKANRIPPEYVPQLTHNFWVTGAQWVDFVSFDNRLPEHLQYLCVRAYANEFDVAGYEKEVSRFLAEVAVELADIKKLRVAA